MVCFFFLVVVVVTVLVLSDRRRPIRCGGKGSRQVHGHVHRGGEAWREWNELLKPQYLNTVVRCVQSKEKKRERQSKCGLCGAEFSILSLSLFSVEMKHTHIHPELGRESRYNMI